MNIPKIKNIDTVADEKFIKLYKVTYEDDHKYIIASRRDKDDLAMSKRDYEFSAEYPDAVSMFVIFCIDHKEYLLLMDEYRHPLGRYILGVPAGIIDDSDKAMMYPVQAAAMRELYEEIGIDISKQEHYNAFLISKEAFSSPGFTDESNALFGIVSTLNSADELNHNNAESTELLGNFKLLNKSDAKKLIMRGVDDRGFALPLITFAALNYFISDIYKSFTIQDIYKSFMISEMNKI